MVSSRDYDEERAFTELNLQIAAYAVFMGLAGMVFFYIGVSMGWLYVCDFFLLRGIPITFFFYTRRLWG